MAIPRPIAWRDSTRLAFASATASSVNTGSTAAYRPTPAVASAVTPMATLSCLESCVGPVAMQCLNCGNDLACWTRCAGGGGDCIARCFA